jgi:hypothetical protein
VSASSTSSVRMLEERADVRGSADDAFWLARKEVRRSWPSFVLTGLFFVFLGFFAVPSVSGIFELEGFGAGGRRIEAFYNALFVDYLFLVVCAFLGVRAVSGDYALYWRDPLAARLVFLRSLPISADSLVGSRALGMLLALLVNAPAFFGPALLLTDLGELGASYLAFAGIWVGYALLASGLCLLCELTVGGRAYARIYFGFAAALMVELALLEWTLDLRLVGRTAELAQGGYGALLAAFSVLAGGAAFAVLARVTVRRLRKRDFSA